MQLTWKQLLLCGTATALAGILGYQIYQQRKASKAHSDSREDANASSEKGKKTSSENHNVGKDSGPTATKKKANKSGPGKKTGKKNAPEGSLEGLPEGIADVMEKCEWPSMELAKLAVDEKQRVFYALLSKGEFMLNQGANPDAIPKALEYFAKAVSIVPNPGEVVAAFEKMLPPPLFNALLDRIQQEIHLKEGEYFKGLAPSSGKMAFKEIIPTTLAVEGARKLYRPMATKELKVAEVLWEETADVTAPSIHSLKSLSQYCEYCLSPLSSITPIKCQACQETGYCSTQCREKSALHFHPFVCKPDPIAATALENLYAHCQEHVTALPILMLRYVALLLSEELRGNGAANNGPFSHYDHLEPVFQAPTEADRREVKLLRQIFSTSNKEVVEFLSDEIYAAMKNTLSRHVVALGDYRDESKAIKLSELETRQVGYGEVRALSFFHVTAHLRHSCDPNVVLIPNEADTRTLKASILKNTKPEQMLTMSYLPFPEGTDTATRKMHLMRVFGIECKCNLCEADLPSP